MNYGVIGVIYIGLQTALLAGVRYWLYQDNLRVSAKIMYPFLAAASLVASALWLSSEKLSNIPFEYFRVAFAVVLFLISCRIIKEPFAKHALSYAFIMAYDATFEATANFLRGIISPTNEPSVYVVSTCIVLAVTFVPCVRVLKKMIDRLSRLENDRIFGQLCVICFSFVFMNLLFTFPVPGKITLVVLLSRYLMFFGMVGVYAAATRVMITMQASAEAKANLELTQKQIELQQSYYDRMITQMDEVRRMRHDLRHHRAALSALVKNGDIEKLSQFIDSDALDDENAPISGNFVADSVLLYFLDAAKALGINVETNLTISKKIPVSDPDLCVILGNVLENAVEAQKYVEPKKRYIKVTAKGDSENLTIAVDNRFDGTLKTENGEYLTRKINEGHGIGIGSVRSLCEKYGGILQLETKDDIFMAGIVIGI